MTIFRLKQICFAVCLMTSLVMGSAAACNCDHHQDEAKSTGTSCHGTHEQAVEAVETSGDGHKIDVNCICFVSPQGPSAASKSNGKKVKFERTVERANPVVLSVRHLSANTPPTSLFEPDGLSYSRVLAALLPSRAPPRL